MDQDDTINPGDSESLDLPTDSDSSDAKAEKPLGDDVDAGADSSSESTMADDVAPEAISESSVDHNPTVAEKPEQSVEAGVVDGSDATETSAADVPESSEADTEAAESDESVETDTPKTDEELAPNWKIEARARTLANELRQVETQVREALDGRDTRRKRKLGGSARWRELEDDIIGWRYSGKIDEPTIAQLQALVARRYYLYDQLDFLSSTRPTWNS